MCRKKPGGGSEPAAYQLGASGKRGALRAPDFPPAPLRGSRLGLGAGAPSCSNIGKPFRCSATPSPPTPRLLPCFSTPGGGKQQNVQLLVLRREGALESEPRCLLFRKRTPFPQVRTAPGSSWEPQAAGPPPPAS